MDYLSNTNYLYKALHLKERQALIRRAMRFFKNTNLSFGAIACRGISGTLIAPILADRLKKPLVVIRKDKSHSNYKIETVLPRRIKRYIIVDDFFVTGKTVCAITKAIATEGLDWKLTNVVLYNDSTSYPIRRYKSYERTLTHRDPTLSKVKIFY